MIEKVVYFLWDISSILMIHVGYNRKSYISDRKSRTFLMGYYHLRRRLFLLYMFYHLSRTLVIGYKSYISDRVLSVKLYLLIGYKSSICDMRYTFICIS